MKNIESVSKISSPFLDKPILINWLLSYCDKVINVDGDDYIIGNKAQESFYKNGKFIINAIKISPSATYSDKIEESIFFYNGKGFKKIKWDYRFDHPAAQQMNWKTKKFMKYDENFALVNFGWLPEWYYVNYIDFNNWICGLKNDSDDEIIKFLDIKNNYNLVDLWWLPEWYYCSSIDTRDWKATITNDKNVFTEYKNTTTYKYDNETQTISPIKWLSDNMTFDKYGDDGFATIRDWELYQQLWFYDDDGIKKFEFELLEWSSDDIYNKKLFVSNDYQEKALDIIRVSLYKDKVKDEELITKVFTRIWNINKLKEVDISKVPNNDMKNGIKYIVTPNIFCIDEFNSRFYFYKNNKIVPLDLGDLKWKLKIYNDWGDRKSGYPLLQLENNIGDREIVFVNNLGEVKKIQNVPKWLFVSWFKNSKDGGFQKVTVKMEWWDDLPSLFWVLSGNYGKIVRHNDVIVSDINIWSKSITCINKYHQNINYNFEPKERMDFIKKNWFEIKEPKNKKSIKEETKKNIKEETKKNIEEVIK